MEQHTDTSSHPVAVLQLINRHELYISIKPDLSEGSFRNWLTRATRERGFPLPVRTGKRTCGWLVAEVRDWLERQPRGGTFDGSRARPRKGTAFPKRQLPEAR